MKVLAVIELSDKDHRYFEKYPVDYVMVESDGHTLKFLCKSGSWLPFKNCRVYEKFSTVIPSSMLSSSEVVKIVETKYGIEIFTENA